MTRSVRDALSAPSAFTAPLSDHGLPQLSLHSLGEVARAAGERIMDFYRAPASGDGIEIKDDNSPVTIADRAAHDVIAEALHSLKPQIAVISEEGIIPPPPAQPAPFWLVDPLDGTRSFIRRDGEFTVNIALISAAGMPLCGVIYLPVQRLLYAGAAGHGAWRQEGQGDAVAIRTRPYATEGWDVVVSMAHHSPKTDGWLAGKPVRARVSASSSLKFCRVAEGVADVYPRLGTTMEWDTAAGQAILEAAGGCVTTPEGTPFRYGKPDYRNGHFIAWGGAPR